MNIYQNFFLIISPPKNVEEFVFSLKKRLRKKLGHGFQGEYSKAHISLFKYEDRHNESLLYLFQSIACHFPSFDIQIHDCAIFTHGESGTIYLKIPFDHKICALAEALCGAKINPHITIARNINPEDFKIAWDMLKNISFNEHFECDRITVLRRGPDDKWEFHIELPLKPRPLGNDRLAILSRTLMINKAYGIYPS